MLDTGNLYDLMTREKVEDWTSQTWEIDWENNRLLSKRIDGIEAVAQAIIIYLSVNYKKHPIFSDRFGNELYDYLGKDKDLLMCNSERLIKEAISPDLRVSKVRNFRIEELDKYTLHFIFDVECEELGSTTINWEMSLNE